MPQSQSSPKGSQIIERPACDQCGFQMWLAQISPDDKGQERRIFECPVCEIAQTGMVST